MNQWLRKIESIGNTNYPIEARQQNINGKLRLLVAIKADGTIDQLKVLESSGHKVLDDAAKNIVRLASPFAPFSEEMRKDTEVLEIIRTWQFGKNLFSTDS
jgi:protein TonB